MSLSDVDGDTTGPDTAAAAANSITILSDGETADTLNWNFDSIAETFDFLGLGETLELTYTVEVDDQNGVETASGTDGEVSTTTETITILITGTNDQPEIAVIDNTAGGAGDLVYETNAALGDTLGEPAAISGSFTITDIDTTDVVTATVTSVAAVVSASASGYIAVTSSGGLDQVSITGDDDVRTITQADLLSFMSLSDVDGDTTGPDTAAAAANSITILSDGETADTLNWNFDSIAETFDFLGLGETLELTYTVEVDDQNGVETASGTDGEVSTTTETITILITGTNDQPEIAVIDNTAGGAGDLVYETNAALGDTLGEPAAISGSFTITDIDTTDVVTATVTSVAAVVSASASGYIAVTSSGGLDQVSITGDDDVRTITQADLLSFMSLSDVDGDTTGPDTAAAAANSITILSDGETADTLNWNFDSIAETFDFLGLGETLELTYTVEVDDQNGVETASGTDGEVSTTTETITILITGTNDQPEIAVIDNTAGGAGDLVYETNAALGDTLGEPAAISGSFTITDIDTTDVVTATVTSVAAVVSASASGYIAVTSSGGLDQVSITGDDDVRTITQADLLSFMSLSDVDGDTTGPDTAAAAANSITILSDGETADTLNWNFDSIAETFDFLGLGETLELTYTVEVDDQNGVETASGTDGEVSTTTETITILITGTNDQPEIAVIDNTAGGAGDLVYETNAALGDTLGEPAAISGSFTITDIDTTDVVTATVTSVAAVVSASASGYIAVTSSGGLDQVSITGDDDVRTITQADLLSFMSLSDVDGDTTGPDTAAAAANSITILSDGETADTLNWNFDSIAETFDFLGLGETLELTYTVEVDDQNGVETASGTDGEVSTTTETITILITGTNDQPEIAVIDNTAGGAGDLVYETNAALGDTLGEPAAISGSFTITDIDTTDVVTATVTSVAAVVSASASGYIAVTSSGGLDQVSITGDDDVRTITQADLLSFMSLSDVDGDTTGPDTAAAAANSITILSDGETADTLNWNFDSIAETFDFLGLGETLELTYTVEVDDQNGVETASGTDGEVSTTTETITILITGTNDQPEIAVIDNTAGGAGDLVYETNAALGDTLGEPAAISGSFTITDIDTTDVVTATVTSVAAVVSASASGYIAVTSSGGLDQVSITGDDDVRTITQADLLSFMSLSDVDGDTTGPDTAAAAANSITILSDGETADTLNWNFDSIAETFDFLGLGETLELTYTVEVDDQNGVETASGTDGEVSTTTETITILITGTNDQPEIAVIDNTAGGAGDLVYETNAALGDTLGEPAAISGSFTITDIDTTDVVTATVTSVAAVVSASASGYIAVTSSGGLDQVSITGDDDVRTITQADLLSFMSLSDVDGDTTGPDTAAAAANSITILSDGETADTLNWNFDSIAETFDFLGLGETLELTYTVEVDDQNGVETASGTDGEVSTTTETITILITGTNDQPEIAVIDNTAGGAGDLVYETNAALGDTLGEPAAISGSFTITDIDTTDVVTATVTSVAAVVSASASGYIAVTSSGGLDQVSITGDDDVRTITQADLLSFMSLSDVDGDTTGPDTAAAAANSITILSDGETADTLNWNFDSIAETFDFLGLGETLELTYTVEVDDQNGVETASGTDGEVSTTTETITILITGTNDQPEIAVIDNTAGGAGDLVYETNAALGDTLGEPAAISGSFTITDIDTTDVVTATVTSVAAVVSASASGYIAVTSSGGLDQVSITGDDDVRTITQADLLSFMSLSDVDGDTTGPDTAAAAANSITILSDGETADTLNWNFDSIAETFDFLGLGETLELTYTVEVDDQNGVETASGTDGEVSTTTETITILITGTNDQPEIAVIDNTAGGAGDLVYETNAALGDTLGEPAAISGSFTITDIDTTDVVTATVTSVAAVVSASASGYIAVTSSGGLDQVSITGDDDVRTITQADLLSFMSLSDVDGDTTGPDTAAAAANSITILSDGETADTLNWNFDSIAETFDFLGLGETLELTYTVEVDDQNGVETASGTDGEVSTTTETITILITGTNDQPEIAVIDNTAGGAGDLVYETNAALGDTLGEPAAISGSFTITDIDTTDVVTATVTSVAAVVSASASGYIAVTSSGGLDQVSITGDDDVRTITQADLLSFMSLSDVDGDTTGPDTAAAAANSITILSDGETADTLNWNFDSIAETFDFLGLGETLELTYTVEVDDQNGVETASGTDGEVSTTTETITILITGTNDQPEIAVIDNTAGGAGDLVYETNAALGDTLGEPAAISGSFTITDIDTTDVVTATVTSVAAVVSASASGYIAVTSSGGLDQVSITGDDDVRTITQADLLSFMSLSDVDGDTTGPDTAAAAANSITILSDGETADTLNWNFDSIAETFDFLGLGETLELTYTVEVDDQNGVETASGTDGEVSTTTETITILITGTNDQPEIAVIDNTAGGAGDLVYETNAALGDTLGEPAAISGSFTITDIDTTDVVTATVTSVAAVVSASASGYIAVTSSGGLDQVSITGDDDVRTITQADLLSFMSLSDVDGDTTGPDTAAAAANSITILSDGETADTLNWNFDSIAETFDFLGLGETLELTYTVEVDDQNGVETASGTDGEVSTTTETITILITGTNDQPEIAVIDNTAGGAGDLVYETNAALGDTLGEPAAISGSFTITDIDTTDVVTATVTSVAAVVSASASGYIAVTSSGGLDQVSITGDDDVRTITQADLLSFMSLSDVDGDTTGPDTAAAAANSITILSDGETADTLNWNFDSIAETFDFLGLGETLELTYTVEVDDQNGVETASGTDGEVSTTTETITILITGTNDQPEIAVIDNTAGGAGDLVYETNAALGDTLGEPAAISGSFTITDIDTTDVVTATVTSVAAVVSASASGYIAVTSSGGLDQVSITGDDDVRTITQADLLSFMSLSDVDGDTTGPDTAAAAANSITILSDGETADTLNWNFDSIAETFDFLGLGETLELTYTVEVDDQNGVETASGTDGEVSTTTETITILITGTNDQPEIAVIDNTAGGAGDLVYETNAALGDTLGEPAAISGSFTITDIDTTDVVTATVTSVAAVVSASASGYIAVTSSGGLDQVSITGDDDVRTITQADLLSFMSLSDVDGDTTGPDTAAAAANSITILSDGETADTLNWNFDSIAETFDFLGLGETLELTYTVEVDDQNGVETASGTDGEVSTTTETITILITGTNDQPEIAVIDNTAGGAGDLVYETNAALGDTLGEPAAISGSFTITDIDTTDVVTATVTSVAAVVSASASGYIAVTSSGGLDQVSITGDDDVRTITQADLLSFMSLSDVDGDTTGPDTAAAAANSITILSDGETADTLNWNFDSIAETFDFLGLGETLELTYTVEVDDQNGVETASGTDGEVSTTTETITILITGTNDQPEIAVIDNTAGGAGDLVYETNAALGDTLGEPAAISGSFTITDIDTTDVVTATVTSVAAVVSASASGYIAVTSSGGLDQVSITGDDDVRTITQADLLSFMSLSDVDGDTTGPDTAAAAANSITILSDGETADTLNWNFDSIAETFDFLGLGETLELTYTVEVDDQNGVETASGTDGEVSTTTETITILITGTNDQPEIGVVAAGDSDAAGVAAGDEIYETDSGLGKTEGSAISGTLTVSDIDTTNVVTAASQRCNGYRHFRCNLVDRGRWACHHRHGWRQPYHRNLNAAVVHDLERQRRSRSRARRGHNHPV